VEVGVLKILFIGDIVGTPGVEYTAEVLAEILPSLQPNLVVANGENAHHGRGINARIAERLYDAGVEILTLGNHTWDKQEVVPLLEEDARVVRPANYPPGTPGTGFTLCPVGGHEVLIINVMGRTFLSQLDCPFRTVDGILEAHPNVRHILVDVHAETTSEKLALGWYLDGRASAVIGTHTHVPTADERILPHGTGFITDVGMVGPSDGILGMDRGAVIRRFTTQMPQKFTVADGPRQFCAVVLELADDTGRTVGIQRLFKAQTRFGS